MANLQGISRALFGFTHVLCCYLVEGEQPETTSSGATVLHKTTTSGHHKGHHTIVVVFSALFIMAAVFFCFWCGCNSLDERFALLHRMKSKRKNDRLVKRNSGDDIC